MAKTYLDETGLALVWAKIKASFSTQAYQTIRANQVNVTASTLNDTIEIAGGGSVTVSGDATNKTVTISSTGEANNINTIKVNGTTITPDSNKAVDIDAVTGVKGNSESSYRTGQVNITAANIGLGNVNNTADANKSVASSAKLTTARYIDGVAFDGSKNIHHFATYAESANAIVVSCTDFAYTNGARIQIMHGSALASGARTLNVNNLGAQHVYYMTTSPSTCPAIPAHTIVEYIYYNNNFWISGVSTICQEMTQAHATAGSSTTGMLISPSVLSTTINNAIAASEVGAVMFKGSVTAYSTITGSAYKKGWYWLVGTNGAGTYAGQTCEVGDMIFAINDKGSSAADSDFTVVQNNLTAGSADPLMDGTKSVGSSAKYAREDHRHPTDTTRAPLASPALTGTPTAPTAGASTNTTQIATTAFVHSAISSDITAITEATINTVCV